jgi:DnaJ-class molecular chaperone
MIWIALRHLAGSRRIRVENVMTSQKGPNIKKKQKCKNCEGKGLLKKGDKVVKCQRCGGTGVR